MNNKNVKVVVAIILIAVNILFWNIVDRLLIKVEWGKDYLADSIVTLVHNIFGIVVFLLLTIKILKIKVGFGKKNLVRGIFWYGLVMCIAIVVNLIIAYHKPETGFSEAFPYVVLTIFTNLSIGIVEEVMYRGMIFGVFRESFGEDKKGIYKSVFASALVFGVVHIVNLIIYPTLIVSTVTQVIYATNIGVLLAVIYYRSDNLLPGVLLHGLLDFVSSIWICFASDINEFYHVDSTSDMNIVFALVAIGMTSPFLISGLWQLRKLFNKRQSVGNEVSDT